MDFRLSRWDSRPKESRLKKWYMGNFDDIADAKRGFMHADGFKDVLAESPRAFGDVKPLCGNLRGILFPLLEDGELNIGTPSGPPEKLYDPIIKVFDEAISKTYQLGRTESGRVITG